MRSSAILFAVSVAVSPACALAQWSERATLTIPTSRTEAAMEYHTSSAHTVLFGGLGVSPFAMRGDTWIYDGTDWTLATPASSPSPRFGASLAHDPIRGRSVLFGGLASQISIAQPSNQTWEWDGSDWTQVTTATAPTGRAYYGLCFDSARQRVVLYGGSTNPGLLITSNETWEYDGSNWQRVALTSPANPGPRQFPGMAFHGALNRVVLFGGINPQTGGNTDTWSFDGVNWTLLPSATPGPGPRNMPRLSYNPQQALCILQGGTVPSTGAPIEETWALSAVGWRQLLVPQPSTRSRSAMAMDLARGKLVLFGGVAPGNVALEDTWVFGALVRDQGPGCPGSNGVPLLVGTNTPQIGSTFTATMTNLAAGAALGAIAASFTPYDPAQPLDFVGMPGCELHVANAVALVLPVIGGTMTVNLPIPASASMLGVTVVEQGLAFDPGVNAAGLVMSNAIAAVIGW
jgi:hypothetical protein